MMQMLKALPSGLFRHQIRSTYTPLVWCCCQANREANRAPELSRYYSTSVADNSRVVICGGGIVGCSVAYHLAKLGWNDIVLLEQGR